MHLEIIEASVFLCIFCLGIFLGAAVRPLLVTAMRKEPALIGPILTAMFSRYNLVALALSGTGLVLELVQARSLIRLLIAGVLAAVLILKLPIDRIVKQREAAGQVRGKGVNGTALDRLHKVVEAATVAVFVLALASFLLCLTH